MKILRNIASALLMIGILLLFGSPVIMGIIAGVVVYLFLGPQTFWEKAVAFLISVVIFLLVFGAVAAVLFELIE